MSATKEATAAGNVPGEQDQSGEPSARHSAGIGVIGRIDRTVRQESVLVAVLAGSFLARWLLADRNSYWYDELLSVSVYGRWHESVSDALSHLASYSIHPPLYQFVLYHWMEWFGDTERATRSLSNLYITLATLFIFLLVRNTYLRRVALASAVVFALMYTPMYYALETRSYAQTIFLVTLSSYVLLRMMSVGADRGWRAALLSPAAALFMAANVALLLTHYYNFFFWAAQAVIMAVFVLRARHPRRWLLGLATVGAMYGCQGAIFVLVWGGALRTGVRRRGGDFVVENGALSPFELLESVVRLNIDPPRLIALAGVTVAALLLIRTILILARGRGLTLEHQRAWTVVYLVGWLLLPLLVVYVAFEITGVARYATRYWLFIVPALAPLVVLAVREGVLLAGRVVRNRWGIGTNPVWPAAAMFATIVTLILPGTLAAATAEKNDWRGIVRQVVDLVEADSNSRYVIVETGWSRNPRSAYYFERFSSEIKPYGTLLQSEESREELQLLTVDEPVIAEHDYLIVLFPHLTTRHFPDTLEQLEERFEARHRQIDRRGRGFVVFDVHPDSP